MSADKPETRKRTAAEIEADLRRAREELTRTVDEISGRVDPRKQAQEAADRGKQFLEDVKAGEPQAVKIAAGVAAVIITVIAGIAIARRGR